MKTCSTCKNQKSKSEFSMDRGRISSTCKKCKTKNTQKWKQANPQKHDKHVKAFWKKRVAILHPSYIEKFLIRDDFFTKDAIKKDPIITEIKQLIIKTKRL